MNLQIKGGRNNKVILLKQKKFKIILKKFKNQHSTKYSRFLTEKIFLEFLKRKKIKNIPKVIFENKEKKIICFRYIDGKQIFKVNKEHLNRCLKFLIKININTTYKNFNFQLASDRCLSLDDHIKTCEIRILRLIKKFQNRKNNKSKKIQEFLKNKIFKSFKKVILEVNNKYSKSEKKKKLRKKHLILSPSDFGFHNIISKKNNLFFIDFEYAGWDDPIKLLCDFFLNPDYLISRNDKKYFLEKFMYYFKNKMINFKDFEIIYKLHFLKWVCVIISQVDIEISKKNVSLIYFKKAVKYFNKNKNLLK